MPLAKLSNGSTFSARPSGENSRQWLFSTKDRMRSSTLIRCSHAFCRRLSVVVMDRGGFDGETGSTSFDPTSRDVSGDSSVALVILGPARRATGAARGFLPNSTGPAMIPTALGVGVSGGGASMTFVRFFVGVLGSETSLASVVDFRFRLFCTRGGGITTAAGFASARALIREDRLDVDMAMGTLKFR